MRPVGAEFGVTSGGRKFAGFRLVQGVVRFKPCSNQPRWRRARLATAMVFSAAVGIAFGQFSVYHAARFDPIGTLRHE